MKMEQQPKFIKDFSKQEPLEKRNRLAQKIREKRAKYFEDQESIESQEQKKRCDKTVRNTKRSN